MAEKDKGTKGFRTRSGAVSAHGRREAESKGDAMLGGRFPIRNRSDLEKAKHAFGRTNDKPAVRRWIDRRARQLGEPPLGGDIGKQSGSERRKRIYDHPRSHAQRS